MVRLVVPRSEYSPALADMSEGGQDRGNWGKKKMFRPKRVQFVLDAQFWNVGGQFGGCRTSGVLRVPTCQCYSSRRSRRSWSGLCSGGGFCRRSYWSGMEFHLARGGFSNLGLAWSQMLNDNFSFGL